MRVDRPPTLTASVAEAMRGAIFRGERTPGEQLREAELSESLGVSRGTVREALQVLHEEGIVEYFPHRGMFVRRLTPRIAKELYTFRALLEPYAIGVAVRSGSYNAGDLEALEDLAHQLGEPERNNGSIYQAVEADVGFHRIACAPCEHDMLLKTLDGLQSLTWLFVLNTKFYHSDDYSDEPSHYEIFDAIRGGQAERAAETARNHIRAAGVALLACMEKIDALN